MNIIVGATGQVGSNIIKELKNNSFPVRAVVRNPNKLSDKLLKPKPQTCLMRKNLQKHLKAEPLFLS